LASIAATLAAVQSVIDRIDARALLREVLGRSDAWLIAHGDEALTEAQSRQYAALVARRTAGEPVAYILGRREFHGRDFALTRQTLIPRPETEMLVELALQHAPQGGRVLDLGTGSGCIGVTLAAERPDLQVTLVDVSSEALDVARRNAQRWAPANTMLLHGDWYCGLAGRRYDLIASNPPYVADGDAHLAQGDLRFEPRAALASGADGLDAIRRIVAGAPGHLEPGGWLLIEHGYDQHASCVALLQRAGLRDVFSARDLAGILRVSGGRQPQASDDG
jgi:release factor glutamine methyltransferase